VADVVNDASSMPMTLVGLTPYRGFSLGEGKPSPYLATYDRTDGGHGLRGGDPHCRPDEDHRTRRASVGRPEQRGSAARLRRLA
jgi:hypothetical protein